MSEHEQEPDESPEPVGAPEGDDEAAEAEEQPDPIEGPGESGGEPEQPAEPEARSRMQQTEPRKAVEKSFKTYTAALSRNYEEEAQALMRCPLCPDNYPGYVHPDDFGKYPSEVAAVIMQVLGFAREQDYEPDPEAHECRTCKGKGKTATGSHVGGNETRDCPTCRGVGYEAPQSSNGHAPVVLDPAHVPAGQQPHALTEQDPDMWGEPRILPDGRANPNYGKMPSMKVTVPPYGVTAGLTAQDSVV